MNKEDLIRFHHMLDAAKEIQHFIQNRTRDDLQTDRMLALSLLKLFEIIGEASANISLEGRQKYPQIPWPNIIGMRNRLVHAYFSINLDIIWETTKTNLPSLIVQLEQIIAENRD